MEIVYYTLILIVLIYLSFKFYIYKKFGFWAYQPVFHYYNIFYWILPSGIINKELSKPNKFCNFYNIQTTDFTERSNNNIQEILNFIHENYYNKYDAKYLPSVNTFNSYFIGNNGKTFISTYYKNNASLDNSNNLIKKLVACMTSRPLNLTIDNKTIKVYYVDYLCVHKENRKDGIAPEIIQTHEYQHSHKNNKQQISLFKREGTLTGIVPLTKYYTYQYQIKRKKNNDRSINIIEITKTNISLLMNHIFELKSKFDILILPDIANLLNLINSTTYIIYGIINNETLLASYFFRKSDMYYDASSEYKNSSIDLFASINNIRNQNNSLNSNYIFVQGFNNIINRIKEFKYVTIENISDNYIILNDIRRQNIISNIENPTAYFLYNYAKKPIKSNKALILC